MPLGKGEKRDFSSSTRAGEFESKTVERTFQNNE
jgi:hypothetical protein